MSVWIVFEYAEHTNKIIGICRNKEKAKKEHSKSPTWRYIEKYRIE